VFAHRTAAAVAAMAAALGGIDAVVFTGGVGERSARVRADVCGRLGFLGIAVDERRNEQRDAAGELGAGPVRVVVVPSREDVVAARAARALLSIS
jgi:acetate kinase